MTAEKLITKTLQRFWRYSRGLTMGAQGAVIDSANRVLLIRHTYRPGWHFPGGGVEKGEAAEDALRRELQEEAGIDITAPPELFGLYANHRMFPGDHIALYVVRSWRQSRIPEPNAEIAEQGFFPLDALPSATAASTLNRVLEIRDLRARSAHW